MEVVKSGWISGDPSPILKYQNFNDTIENNPYFILTASHNICKKKKVQDKDYVLADKIYINIGKYQNYGHIQVINDSSTLKLDVILKTY